MNLSEVGTARLIFGLAVMVAVTVAVMVCTHHGAVMVAVMVAVTIQ